MPWILFSVRRVMNQKIPGTNREILGRHAPPAAVSWSMRKSTQGRPQRVQQAPALLRKPQALSHKNAPSTPAMWTPQATFGCPGLVHPRKRTWPSTPPHLSEPTLKTGSMHPPVTAQGKGRQKPAPLHILMPFGPNQNFWPGDVRDDQPHSSVATFLNRIPDVPNTLPHGR